MKIIEINKVPYPVKFGTGQIVKLLKKHKLKSLADVAQLVQIIELSEIPGALFGAIKNGCNIMGEDFNIELKDIEQAFDADFSLATQTWEILLYDVNGGITNDDAEEEKKEKPKPEAPVYKP